jgi:hypothetical protein
MSLAEPKMQSTSQAGPEINRDLEILFGKATELVRAVNALQTTVDALAGGSTGAPPSSTEPPPSEGQDNTPTLPTTEASATVLAGTGEPEDTEDAWTTVPSGVPAGATMVLVEGRMWSTNDDAGGTVEVRTENGSQEITLAVIRADGTSDADRESVGWYPLPVDADGDIQYKANTTAGTLGWSLKRLGYW